MHLYIYIIASVGAMKAGARNSLDQGGCESLGWEMGAGVDVGAALTSGIPGQVVKVETRISLR